MLVDDDDDDDNDDDDSDGDDDNESRGAQAFLPNLCGVVADGEKVFRIERVSVDGGHSTVVARVKHAKNQTCGRQL